MTEVAVCFVLLVCRTADPGAAAPRRIRIQGFKPKCLTLRTTLPTPKYDARPGGHSFMTSPVGIQRLPGVKRAAYISSCLWFVPAASGR